MGRHILQIVFILLSCSDISESFLQCLTWDIDQERLKFTCRVPDFSHPVSLINSQGKLYVKCTFNSNVQNCTPFMRNDLVETNYALNHVIFTTEGLNTDMNGLWVCSQDNLKLKTYVTLSKGIIDSTKVILTSQFHNDKENPRIILRCFSCREPDGNNVEFLENKRSIDSLTLRRATGKCTHKKGECHPNECSCAGMEFMRTFQYDIKSNGSVYSCDMLFTDSYTHEKFSILASAFFNGKEFYNTDTSTVIIKAGDNILNGTFASNKMIEIATELEPVSITPITETSAKIPEEHAGGFRTIHVIAIVMGCVTLFICVLAFRWKYSERKNSRKGMTHDNRGAVVHKEFKRVTASHESMGVEVYNDSETITETHDITVAHVHIESKPFLEKAVFKRNVPRNVTDWYICDSCTYQSQSRSAIFLCIDCEKAMCAICSHYHNASKQNRNHKCVSINKVPRNFSLPLTCTCHDTMKYDYFCVDHECLCCLKCITSLHAGKVCKVEVIDEVSKGFIQTQVFNDYDHQLNRYIGLLANLSTYQYHMIDRMADSSLSTFGKLRFEENDTDSQMIKLELNAYATEICEILFLTREQKDLFEFMKTYGSERQLFILTHFLKQSLSQTDKKVLELVANTKERALRLKCKLQDDHVTIFPSIEMTEIELKNMSPWRQSQTSVTDSILK